MLPDRRRNSQRPRHAAEGRSGASGHAEGFLCADAARCLEREYHLLHPLRRKGAKGEARFERISWDERLDTIAARLKTGSAEFGPESVLPCSYGGTLGLLQGGSMDRRFFHRLGASRPERTICASALQRSRGPRRMMAAPSRLAMAPSVSQRSGALRSTSHIHTSDATM